MNVFLLLILALPVIAAAGYAQLQIPRYTAARLRVLLTRAILIATGIALGYVPAVIYTKDPLIALLIFLIGFGVVHVPAAFILFIKRERGAGKT
jgi:hypothetical protein